MKAPEQQIPKQKPKTVKEQLAERAHAGCSRCGGRGHLGVNVETDRYVACRCVKRKLTEKPPTGELAARWLEAARGRITQNTKHLERLHEEITRLVVKEVSCATDIGVAQELTEEEQEIQLEAEFEQRRIDRMHEMVMTYLNKVAALEAETRDLVNLAANSKKEAARCRLLVAQHMREAALMESAVKKEEKRLRDNSEADGLASQRAAKIHKLNKKRREIQARMDKLRVRAGKVQITIDEDVAIVSKHEKKKEKVNE